MSALEENFAMVYRWENSKMLPSKLVQKQFSEFCLEMAERGIHIDSMRSNHDQA